MLLLIIAKQQMQRFFSEKKIIRQRDRQVGLRAAYKLRRSRSDEFAFEEVGRRGGAKDGIEVKRCKTK